MDLKQYKNELEKQTKDVTDVEEFVKIAKQLVDKLEYQDFEGVGLDMDFIGFNGTLLNVIEYYIYDDMPEFEDECHKSFDNTEKIFETWKQQKINQLEDENKLKQADELSSLESAHFQSDLLASANDIFISIDGYYPRINVLTGIQIGNPNVVKNVAEDVIDLVNGEKGAVIDEIDFVVYEQEQVDDINEDNKKDLIEEIIDRIEDMMDLSSIEDEVIYDLCLKKHIYFEGDDDIKDLIFDELDEEFENNFK